MTESTIRRQITALGHRLEKTPARHWSRAHYEPGYQVLDDRNLVVVGCYSRAFDATLDDVRTWLAGARRAA